MKKNLLLLCCMFILTCRIASAQCVASYTWSVQSLSPPVVAFYDSSLISQPPATYTWTFGDGSPASTQQHPVHTFPANGSWSVCLTISDASGCSDSSCILIDFSPVAPYISAFLGVDSLSNYSCSAPATVPFYFYTYVQGYLGSDSLQYEFNFGDGVDSIIYLMNTGSVNGAFDHTYLNAGNYTPFLIVTGPDGTADTVTAVPTVTIGSSCGTISGTVYQDNNGNCINDAGDNVVPNTGVELFLNGQFIAWANTDVNGIYSFNVPSGPGYEIHVYGSFGYTGHYVPSCPASGIILNASAPSVSNDFGLICPQGYDLQGSAYSWGLRPGFNGNVCIQVYNSRCTTPSGQIVITLDPSLTPLPDSTGSYTISGNTVTYPIGSPDLYWSFCIPVSVSQSALVGDTVCTSVSVEPIVGDSVPSNNTWTSCAPLVGSFDPNDKAVSPAGFGPNGAILPNTDLTYTIRFQNTGTADAINVFILDTLSVNVDAATLEVIATSHTMTYSILAGNIIRFNFDNIHLPDSNASETASHGYVSYRVHQLNNLPQLSTITNTAAIFFDFNQAVITNTTLNTVDQFASVGKVNTNSSLVNVYPNPSNGQCRLFFRDNHSRTISVADLLGREVYRTSSKTDSFILNTEKYADGTYTVRVQEEEQTSSYKLIVAH